MATRETSVRSRRSCKLISPKVESDGDEISDARFASILLPFAAQVENYFGTDHDEAPNVVFILADDLGWGDLAVYGNPRVETPNLDGPASEGVLLTQFCMMSPDCSPSRAAIRTGRNPAELGIHYAIGAQAVDTLNNPDWLDADLATIYGVTRGAGY